MRKKIVGILIMTLFLVNIYGTAIEINTNDDTPSSWDWRDDNGKDWTTPVKI